MVRADVSDAAGQLGFAVEGPIPQAVDAVNGSQPGPVQRLRWIIPCGTASTAETASRHGGKTAITTLPRPDHRLFGRFSKVGTTPFLDPEQFSWTPLLEAHYPAIRAEAERVLQVRSALPNFQDVAPEQIRVSEDDRWKAYWFVGYGIWDHPNCIRCPLTAAVLRSIPGLTTGLFSILGPGKRLRPHRGPYRGVLRHHLAIIVPEPATASGIKVGDEVRHWNAGRSLVFDDTYQHEAWNELEPGPSGAVSRYRATSPISR